jgi:putative membrane-bound dehydrogenase-like protein
MRLLFLSVASVFSVLHAAEPVTKKIDLLEVIKSGNVEHHVNPKMDFHDDPKEIWTFAKDGTFNISGRGYGYVATKENYRDYHLVIEFKWGTKTWGAREKKAKDNGILLHAYGPHGAYSDTWMASIEAQIIEGGVGDILVLSPKLADGTELTTSLSAEFALDRDKEKIWKADSPRQTVTKGRINWKGRDEDWSDTVGFRGKNDVESPSGEWNRLEVIAKGDTLQYFVNGAMVNEAFDCKPSEGKILLQTEGAEMIVRRYELYPLGEFKEKWSAIQASGGSDIAAVRDGQSEALSPEESIKRIQLDGPYEVQLVAAEPLVLDPVEATWDEKGRMFVADMRDYPLGPPNPGDPWLSRIQLLTDENGDGRMDKAVTFADHMDNVQGLLPYDSGLIATTRSQILFLKDTDGDNKADLIKPLIRGFNPKHSQLQVSAPRWGPDGCVHFNNGLDAKEIYPADAPTKVVGIPGSNFKWNPKTGEITPTGGRGQYGGAFDDYGHHFYCSNRNPLMFTVMPYDSMLRNPHAGITQVHEDIATPGAETRVYPLQITHTTADAHAGTNTACSGLGVYRGHLMPELKNNVFVPDPTGQLVTRYKIEPNGASLKATRVGDRTEFFRSSDEWCRPVNFTTGPDGAIYICDIYRRWIDHARFFPEEFVKTHDMRQGENHGRIWRVVPKSGPAVSAGSKAAGTAAPHFKPLPEHPERALLFRILQTYDDGQISSPEEIRFRANCIADHPEDEWIARAVLSSSEYTEGRVLKAILQSPNFTERFSPARSATIRAFAAGAIVTGNTSDVAECLRCLELNKAELLWWKAPLLQGVIDGFAKGYNVEPKSLSAFMALPPPDLEARSRGMLDLELAEFQSIAKEIAALQTKIDTIIADAKAPLDQRLAVLPLLASRKWDAVQPVLKSLLSTAQPAELTAGAMVLLKRFSIKSTEPFIYELLPHSSPTLKGQFVAILAASAPLDLLKRMERGEIPKALVDIERRWGMQRGKGELADLAKKLFGEASSDRAAVIASYMDATKKPGDATKGKAVFSTICISCHKAGGVGMDVGPSLADVKVKPPEGLLSDILDPNRMFEARWTAYQIDTKDGRSLSGLIANETTDAVELVMMGGLRETLSRSAIKDMKSLDRSLMPLGLEAAVTQEQMSDLLAFLLGK